MENSTESQNKRIKAWLESGHKISALDALNLFDSFRLSARIFDLRNDYGMDIKSEMVEDPITGKRYAKYWLNKPE